MGANGLGLNMGRVVAAAATCAVGLGVTGLTGAAHATSTNSRIAAPYDSAERGTDQSCHPHDLLPECRTSAAADARHGVMDVAAAVDSGAGGNVPGPAAADAYGELVSSIPVGNAQSATIAVHLHIVRGSSSATVDGHSVAIMSAGLGCDSCLEQYTSLSGPSDETLTMAYHRAGAATTVRLVVRTYAGAWVECDDFCLAPRGVAQASARVVLTGVDIHLGAR